MPKTLVTSVDYSTTEPAALARWLALDNATVQIAGTKAMAEGRTTPSWAFHPKVYAFHANDQTSGVLVTSANLTGRGLTANVEAGWLQQRVPSAEVDAAFSAMCEDTETLTEDMLEHYARVRSAQPRSVPREADTEAVTPFSTEVGGLTPLGIAVDSGEVDLMAFDQLWLHVEKLQGGSGNQLELPRGGHRFFGLEFFGYDEGPNVVPIGHPLLRMGSKVWRGRPLTWHGNNKMERLNLPTHLQGGPDYSNSAILFRRLSNRSFELVVTGIDSDLARAWAHASQQSGKLFRLGTHSSRRLVGLL